MLKSLILIAILVLTSNAYGQLAVIKDPDGFTNVRESKSASSKIVGRLNADDIFLYDFDNEGEQWVGVYLDKAGKRYIQGYIHKSRLQPLDKLEKATTNKDSRVEKQNELILQNDSVKVVIKTANFTPKEHRIGKDKQGYVTTIDGKAPKGVDGNLPKIELISITVTFNGKPVAIPLSAYNDLYEPNVSSFNIYFDKKGTIFLYMSDNSDGAGGYSVAWIIKDGKYLKRYVDSI
jgi:hypothetical protein